jgi:L-seryl-tRNA(Ser) seleniumtransferase
VDAPFAEWPAASAADIPSVDQILSRPALLMLRAQQGRTQVTSVVRAHLSSLREAALAGTLRRAALTEDAIFAAVQVSLTDSSRSRLRAVFNLTGTVLHTNLGRALLPEESVRAVAQASAVPVNLEFNLDSGARGDRDALIEELLCELTGAEAATVVNNNAAAVFLLLSVIASRREVVISRGELIEIGGSFRMPEIMQQARAKLVEVGTTNRTHAADYAQAIGPRTALLMKVHPSNYAISGFIASVSVSEMVELGRAQKIPVAVDLGSGSLADLTRWQLPKEPTVRETVSAGADLVTFSGDKLLGGPQAGVLVGRAELIRKLNKHPLKRALRVGKLTLTALESVLTLYRAPEFLAERLTTLRLLTRSQAVIRSQAIRLQPILQAALGNAYEVTHAAMLSQIGSGAMPVEQLASYGLVVRPSQGRHGSLDRLASALRAVSRPVLGRIAEKALWLDLRCLEESEEAVFAEQCSELSGELQR